MSDADDLLPPDVLGWLIEQLREYRTSRSHGTLELHIQDGYIDTHAERRVHKRGNRIRNRTRSKNS